jgi:predicted phosphodiesterase
MDISKHVASDHYRKMGSDASSWGEKYLRKDSKRFQTILVGADFHDKNTDTFALRVFLDTARRAAPDTVVIAGDLFDNYESSRYTKDPRRLDILGSFRFVHDRILGPLRQAVPEAQIDLIGGNHEFRVLKDIADQLSWALPLLHDFHGFTLQSFLGLDKHKINYVHKGDLSAWTKHDQFNEANRNWRVYHDCFLVTHDTKLGLQKHMPGVSGHNHKHLSWSFESPTFGAYEWHQLGCMNIRDADYTNAERWNIGFALVHVDTEKKRSLIEYVPVGETEAWVGGKQFLRDPKTEAA